MLWAQALYNGEFFCIETYLGPAPTIRDANGIQHLLSNSSDNATIGKALCDALSKSRSLTAEDSVDFRKIAAEYDQWVKGLLRQYGYKTKKSMFKDMNCCSIQSDGNILTIEPSVHEALEGWSGDGIKAEDYVNIPCNSSHDEIGAALILAFGRCSSIL